MPVTLTSTGITFSDGTSQATAASGGGGSDLSGGPDASGSWSRNNNNNTSSGTQSAAGLYTLTISQGDLMYINTSNTGQIRQSGGSVTFLSTGGFSFSSNGSGIDSGNWYRWDV
jgi:hypothetical protein